MERLAGTHISTIITIGGQEIFETFGLIERAKIVRKTRDGRMQKIEVKLSDYESRIDDVKDQLIARSRSTVGDDHSDAVEIPTLGPEVYDMARAAALGWERARHRSRMARLGQQHGAQPRTGVSGLWKMQSRTLLPMSVEIWPKFRLI